MSCVPTPEVLSAERLAALLRGEGVIDAPAVIPDRIGPADRVTLLESIAAAGVRDPIVETFARNMSGRFSSYETLARAIQNAVQKLTYVEEFPLEIFQGVRWTLACGGDCEDFATVVCALARASGLRARIVWLSQQGSYNHVTAQVSWSPRDQSDDRAIWWWIETTIPADFGEDPYTALARVGGARRIYGVG